MLTSIELRHLRYFLAAAEQGSFRKAGAALGVRESSISRGIRDLEAHLGASLFRRQLGGASLNPAGFRFLQQVQAAMVHLRNGARDAGAIGRSEKGHIRIGIFSSLASGFLSDLFQAYGTLYAGVRIDFVEGRQADHIAAIRQHQLDAAFIAGNGLYSECDIIRLWSEKIFAALPSSHHLAQQAELDWSDFADETLMISEQALGCEIEDQLSKYLADSKTRPDILWQNVGRDNLISLVAIGCGLALACEATTAICLPGIVYRPIAGEKLPFGAVWLAKNDNPALHRLLKMARARQKIAETIGLPTVASSVGLSQTLDQSP